MSARYSLADEPLMSEIAETAVAHWDCLGRRAAQSVRRVKSGSDSLYFGILFCTDGAQSHRLRRKHP